MLLLLLLLGASALRSQHEEAASLDSLDDEVLEVPAAVSCQIGNTTEEGCSSVCRWLDMTKSPDNGQCHEFVERLSRNGYKKGWIGRGSSSEPILKVLSTNCLEEELEFFLKIILELLDKMPEKKRMRKYRPEMDELQTKVVELLKKRDPDYAMTPPSCKDGDTLVSGCVSVCRRLGLTKSSENGQCEDLLEQLEEKGYRKHSAWKIFGSASAMEPILKVLRTNCRDSEITYYSAAILQLVARMPEEKKIKYQEELKDLQSAVSMEIVEQLEEYEDDDEVLPKCDKRMKIQAGDLLTMEVGGPDFVRDVAAPLDEMNAEHEALQLRAHFRYGKHFNYSDHLFKIEEPKMEEEEGPPPDLERPNDNLKEEPEPVAPSSAIALGDPDAEDVEGLDEEIGLIADADAPEVEAAKAIKDKEDPDANDDEVAEKAEEPAASEAEDEEVEVQEVQKVESKLKQKLIKGAKNFANGFFKVCKYFADAGINTFKGIGDLLINTGVVLAKGLVWTAARVTGTYGRVRQTTRHTGETRFTHTALGVGENLVAEAGQLGVETSTVCMGQRRTRQGKIIISRFVGDGTVDAEKYRSLAGWRATMWEKYLTHYADTVGQWHRVVLGKCYSAYGTPGKDEYFQAVNEQRVKEMWDYEPADEEADEEFIQEVADSISEEAAAMADEAPAPKAKASKKVKKPKAMFCSKFGAAVWSSTIGNPSNVADAAVRSEDLRAMLPLNPGACSPWSVGQWFLGKQGRKYWKSCLADAGEGWDAEPEQWNPCTAS